MNASSVGAATGFTAKQISELAERGIIAGTGGGGKGKPRVFNDETVRLCAHARALIDGLSIPVGDAFRIAKGVSAGESKFGRVTLRIDQ